MFDVWEHPPAKMNLFYMLDSAQITNLSPLASEKLKLVAISFFLNFKAVQLYHSPTWTRFFFLGGTFFLVGGGREALTIQIRVIP